MTFTVWRRAAWTLVKISPFQHYGRKWRKTIPLNWLLYMCVLPAVPQSLCQGLCERLARVRRSMSGSASRYHIDTAARCPSKAPLNTHLGRTGVCVCVWALFSGAIRKGWWSWELRSVWTIHPSFPSVYKVPSLWV